MNSLHIVEFLANHLRLHRSTFDHNALVHPLFPPPPPIHPESSIGHPLRESIPAPSRSSLTLEFLLFGHEGVASFSPLRPKFVRKRGKREREVVSVVGRRQRMNQFSLPSSSLLEQCTYEKFLNCALTPKYCLTCGSPNTMQKTIKIYCTSKI